MSAATPLKHLVRLNAEDLPEGTDPDYEFPYVDIGSVGRGVLIDPPARLRFGDAPSRARRVVRGGDTIVSTVRTYLRAVWRVPDNVDGLIASTGFVVLTPGTGIDSRYLGWWAQGDRFIEEIVSRSVGVSYPAVNPSTVGEIRVPAVPLDQQRQTADLLDTETARIDALIAKKLELIDLLKARLRANAARLTAAAITIGLNGAGSRVASGWHAVRLRRCLAQMDYGIGESSKSSGAVAVLGMGNVDDSGHVVGDPGGYVETIAPEMLLRPGDLLFNRTNSLVQVGKVGLVRNVTEPTTFASYLVRFRTSPLASSEYLNFALNTNEFLGLARSAALPSIGQANLNPSRYGELRIAVPPRDEQARIVTGLDADRLRVEAVSQRLQRQIVLAREHRQALITAAVTGSAGAA